MEEGLKGVCRFCVSVKNVLHCNDCNINFCIECNMKKGSHQYCNNCSDITCSKDIICKKCIMIPYTMITDDIGVGKIVSAISYSLFDVIIDMNYPNNGIMLDDIKFSNYGNKILIKIGLEDNDEANIITFFNKLIPMLTAMKKNKILFYSTNGISRSAAFAIAFISIKNNIMWVEAYNMVKMKRKMIKPNMGFLQQIELFCNKNIVSNLI